jgi:hypothetical protein
MNAFLSSFQVKLVCIQQVPTKLRPFDLPTEGAELEKKGEKELKGGERI